MDEVPLMLAVGARQPECVKLLLASGADVNAADAVSNGNLLRHCMAIGCLYRYDASALRGKRRAMLLVP